MISTSRSSVERSPPLASGWWRFTSCLEANLDLGRRGADFEAEHLKRLAFGIADWPCLRLGLLLRAQALAEQFEGSPPSPTPRKSGRSKRLPVPIFQVGRWPVSASF